MRAMERRLIAQSISISQSTAVMSVILFVAAGTLRWVGAWIFILETFALNLVFGILLWRNDPVLATERVRRFGIQKGQVLADKIIQSLSTAFYVCWMIVMALDAGRFGWSTNSDWLRCIGIIGIFLSL